MAELEGKVPKNSLGKPGFLIRLNLKQNVTWQGELHWINAGRKVHFRSLLELIALMQEAIDISAEPHGEYELRSWYDDHTKAEFEGRKNY